MKGVRSIVINVVRMEMRVLETRRLADPPGENYIRSFGNVAIKSCCIVFLRESANRGNANDDGSLDESHEMRYTRVLSRCLGSPNR